MVFFVAVLGWFDGERGVMAQGALTPPGAPGATMKTLDQVEARRPIGAVPFTISTPGSYYFTTNLVATTNIGSGITVQVPNVTIDLNGFNLQGASNSGSGISISGGFATNVTIRNGTIVGWGGSGIAAASTRMGRIENLQVLFNEANGVNVSDFWTIVGVVTRGNGNDGIESAHYAHVEDCLSLENGADGIRVGNRSIVKNCRIGTNSMHGLVLVGISVVVEGCTIFGSGGNGILSSATAGHHITRCIIQESALCGISLANCCHTVTDNNVIWSGFDGIRVANESLVARNNVNLSGQATNNGAGIRVTSTRNRLEENTMANADNGIAALNGGNFIVRNHASANSTNYFFFVNQNAGPLQTTSGIITNLNPWANFSY